MNATHTDQSRLRRSTPRYFYHTPFSYIAFWLTLLMIVPMSGRVTPVPDAQADGANGICQFTCTTQSDGTGFCTKDLTDPDCSGNGTVIGVSPVCSCQDGTSIIPDVIASDPCGNACQNHGGECSLLSCYVFPPEEPNVVGGLDFFNSDASPLRVFAFDPDTNALVLNKAIHAIIPLGNLVFRATTEVLTDHGLPASDRSLVTTWARDRVRAQILTDFVNIIGKPTSTKICSERKATVRSCEEDQLYDWLTHLVWKKRIATAQIAWDQYRSWRYAVDFAKCDWQSPTKDGIYTLTAKENCTPGNGPDGRPATEDDETCFFNKQSPGCSPGIDGVPGTDTSPNQGSFEDVLAGRDDGEICFALPKEDSFVKTVSLGDNDTPSYDAITASRCNGAPVFWDVNLAAHPTVEHFLEYGLAIARKNEIITPGFASVMGNTFKDEAFGIGAGIALGTGVATGAAVYRAGGWTTYTHKIAPYIGRALHKGASEAAKATAKIIGRIASAAAAAAVVVEVIGNIVTAILTIIDIVEFNDVPIKLKEVVRGAYGVTETSVKISDNYTFTTGKPNLQTLIATDAGKDEVRFALVEAMSPDKDVSDTTAPLPDPTQFWAQKKQDGTPVSVSPLNQKLLLTSWDVNKPYELQQIGLYGGWFVSFMRQETGEIVPSLDLGLDYKDCDGKQRRVWRVGGEEFVTMPMGATAAEFDLTTTTKSKEFQYLSYDQTLGCLTARINHAPTVTGFTITSSENLTEGQPATFTGTASDPDNDTVNLTWSFGDRTSSATGSSVQHTFADSGSLQVVLLPRDVFGASGATKTQPITVANVAPTATLPTPDPVGEGSPFTLSLTNPSDPSTADTQAGFQYAFNCGNGFGSFGSSNTVQCPTVDNGNFAVAAKIKDKDGGENPYTATAVVNNVAPSVETMTISAGLTQEGSPLTVQTTFSDPAGTRDAPFTCAVDFGDGTGPHAGQVSSSTCTVTYAYPDNGPSFLVAGIVTDKDRDSGRLTNRFAIGNVPPTATFTATSQIFQGESATLAFSQQADPSPADTTAGFTYAYNCTTSGTLTVANNRAASATCKYLTTGTFTVGGTIRDKDNGANSYPASVNVISPQQAATDLKAQVVALNLGATRTSDLNTKIDNALQKLAQGQKAGAQKQLQDFIKKVNDIVKQKLITAAQGQVLIDTANLIIASIAVS
ncbi:MAG: PKD domain-containing protein [Deltaproteobacteria bacterium]|nr:PKD domain-containing protein [Deltaproteobacteria bacterium]